MPSAVAEKKRTVSVPPFSIEMDNPRNCNVLVQCIGNCILRSRIKSMKKVFDKDRDTGEQVERDAPAGVIPGIPEIPGMEIHVNPAECTYVIIDPLADPKAEPLLAKIKRAIDEATSLRTANKIRGVPKREGKVDVDLMKTLVREMFRFIESGDARIKKGPQPDMLDIEELPGDYLNLDKLKGYHVPRYEKDIDDWVQTLNQLK